MLHRKVLFTFFVLCTAAVAAPAVEQLDVFTSGQNGDLTWSAQQVVGDAADNTCGNPCPVLDESTGTLWLLRPHPLGTDGEREIAARMAQGTGTVWISNSTDHGKARKVGAPIRPKVNMCQVAELFDGRGTLMMNMRSNHGRTVHAHAPSTAGGATRSEITAADRLAEPVCQASLIRHETKPGAGGHLISPTPAAQSRLQLTVKTSGDDGMTLREQAVLAPGRSAYSTLVPLAPDTVGSLYENGEKRAYGRITFVCIALPAP